MYELHDVIKSYGEGADAVRAVDGVTLAISQGEFVAIEGPAGSGKSTLLQLLGALERASAGRVTFDGTDLAVVSERKLADLRLQMFGFVFQEFNLVPTLSAAENVETALAPLGGSRRHHRERTLQLLNGVGLGDRTGHLPSQLSGGEQQRVAIARALSKGPKVVLADEPTGNLDTRTANEIMSILQRVNTEMGHTVVLATRDAEVAQVANRVIRMHDGRIDPASRNAPAAAPITVTTATPTAGATPPPQPRQPDAEGWIDTASTPRHTGEALLHAEGVIKHYITDNDDVIGVDGVSLTVHEGEFVAITGPSGSGKTTLLNCLSGLDRIDSGRVLIKGHTIHDLSDKEQSHLRSEVMGFIFQNWNLVPVFSAVENVELPLLLNGVKPADARTAAIATLERIGLGHRLHHHPNALSGGEQQRVAIARALSAGPALVWADEPTGNLDSHTADSVVELLRELNADGLAIVLVTHDETIAEQASRRIYMRDGRLLADMTRRSGGLRKATVTQPAAAAELPPEDPYATAIPELIEQQSGTRHRMSKGERRAAKRAARMSEQPRPEPDPSSVSTGSLPPPPAPAPPPPEPETRRDPSPAPRQANSPITNAAPEPVRYDDPF